MLGDLTTVISRSTCSVCNEDPLPGLQTLISRVLQQVRGRNDIDDKTLQYLMVNDPRLGRFYLLPKIQKRLFSVPGRPVISNCAYITKNIFSFLDFYLQPLTTKVKSYIKDTNDFLLKLKSLPSLPANAILCTIDVVGLYPSTLDAMRKALDARDDKDIGTESLIQLADLVLKNIFFEHNQGIFKQERGTAIGTGGKYLNLCMGCEIIITSKLECLNRSL